MIVTIKYMMSVWCSVLWFIVCVQYPVFITTYALLNARRPITPSPAPRPPCVLERLWTPGHCCFLKRPRQGVVTTIAQVLVSLQLGVAVALDQGWSMCWCPTRFGVPGTDPEHSSCRTWVADPCHRVIHRDSLLCSPSLQWSPKWEPYSSTGLIFWECVRNTNHKSPSLDLLNQKLAGAGGGVSHNLCFSPPFRRSDLGWRQSCRDWAPPVSSAPKPTPKPCDGRGFSRHKDLEDWVNLIATPTLLLQYAYRTAARVIFSCQMSGLIENSGMGKN